MRNYFPSNSVSLVYFKEEVYFKISESFIQIISGLHKSSEYFPLKHRALIYPFPFLVILKVSLPICFIQFVYIFIKQLPKRKFFPVDFFMPVT